MPSGTTLNIIKSFKWERMQSKLSTNYMFRETSQQTTRKKHQKVETSKNNTIISLSLTSLVRFWFLAPSFHNPWVSTRHGHKVSMSSSVDRGDQLNIPPASPLTVLWVVAEILEGWSGPKENDRNYITYLRILCACEKMSTYVSIHKFSLLQKLCIYIYIHIFWR